MKRRENNVFEIRNQLNKIIAFYDSNNLKETTEELLNLFNSNDYKALTSQEKEFLFNNEEMNERPLSRLIQNSIFLQANNPILAQLLIKEGAVLTDSDKSVIVDMLHIFGNTNSEQFIQDLEKTPQYSDEMFAQYSDEMFAQYQKELNMDGITIDNSKEKALNKAKESLEKHENSEFIKIFHDKIHQEFYIKKFTYDNIVAPIEYHNKNNKNNQNQPFDYKDFLYKLQIEAFRKAEQIGHSNRTISVKGLIEEIANSIGSSKPDKTATAIITEKDNNQKSSGIKGIIKEVLTLLFGKNIIKRDIEKITQEKAKELVKDLLEKRGFKGTQLPEAKEDLTKETGPSTGTGTTPRAEQHKPKSSHVEQAKERKNNSNHGKP